MTWLWVDLTTSYQDYGRLTHGTLRVERGIVSALAQRDDPRIGFVARERSSRSLRTLSPAQAWHVVTASASPERERELAGVWTRRRWAAQRRLRRLVARSSPSPRPALGQPPPFSDGDVLLLCGEHDRHDFGGLADLKRRSGVRLVFVFFDLLLTLDDDDPRLASGEPSLLPQSDFMVREASLLLPISQFSAADLAAHATRRRVRPPIEPIRLAGHLAHPATCAKPVPNLAPGEFVLSVGDVVHRKNHRLLVRAWAILAENAAPVPTLVIVGRIDLEGNELVRSVRRDPALARIIRFMPNVDDASLLWLYRHCRFTAFPSLLEGFGLPVAESLSHGKVCLASSRAAIPEAGQGAAITLDPEDPSLWAAEVLRLNDAAVLAAEQARISRRFRPVAWSDTAEDILAALARHACSPCSD